MYLLNTLSVAIVEVGEDQKEGIKIGSQSFLWVLRGVVLGPVFPHKLQTGSQGGPGQNPLHLGRRTGRFPEHDPGLTVQELGDSRLLRSPATGRPRQLKNSALH